MEQPLGNPSELWKSPRGTVIRIEVLALVAIALSFFFVAFGSSRRWSNRWIIQKGVLAANALSLSLGTYSIGLMQSSSVKSEMYPIWAVSLLTLFGSVDSITGYSLDYNTQLLKLLYQLCLYCGYVLLIGISTISSDVGNIAIGVLCAITFIKGFHRSLASVLMSRLRSVNKLVADYMEDSHPRRDDDTEVLMRDYPRYVVDWPLDKAESDHFTKRDLLENNDVITIDKIWRCALSSPGSVASSYKDVCFSFSLCHLLQRRFFGFTCDVSDEYHVIRELIYNSEMAFKIIDFQLAFNVTEVELAFKVIEVELAFLFDIFFTNNAFLHYYESKAATIWTFASITGILFVGVVTAIPGTRKTHISGGTAVVNTTTTYDLVITLVILVSLVLLQVLQLIRCWTSNWARVSLVCQFIRNGRDSFQMRVKAFMCKINWFNNYVWQRKLGQYSFVESINTRQCVLWKHVERPLAACITFARMFGLRYIEQVYNEMFGIPTGTNPVVLSTAVKKIIGHCYIHRLHYSVEKNLAAWTYSRTRGIFSDGITGPKTMLAWHIATCYLEMKQSRNKDWFDGHSVEEHRETLVGFFEVATTLSKYYAYLIVSAPELLPPKPLETKSAYNAAAREARQLMHGAKDKYEAMRYLDLTGGMITDKGEQSVFQMGVDLGRSLENQPVYVLWKELAQFWANRLISAAPSDNVKEHINHLSRGGEFITHLWAMMFHAGIVRQNQVTMSYAGDP